jgi:nucleoside-diphosphate-sugar epimerase
MRKILVTGGAGYIGSALVSRLLENYKVIVYDLFIYGDPFEQKKRGRKSKKFKNLTKVKGDIRDTYKLRKAMKGVDVVMHLACVSNDPSF